jgi:hypothetical protein
MRSFLLFLLISLAPIQDKQAPPAPVQGPDIYVGPLDYKWMIEYYRWKIEYEDNKSVPCYATPATERACVHRQVSI